LARVTGLVPFMMKKFECAYTFLSINEVFNALKAFKSSALNVKFQFFHWDRLLVFRYMFRKMGSFWSIYALHISVILWLLCVLVIVEMNGMIFY
jgi:hypothetical protein